MFTFGGKSGPKVNLSARLYLRTEFLHYNNKRILLVWYVRPTSNNNDSFLQYIIKVRSGGLTMLCSVFMFC